LVVALALAYLAYAAIKGSLGSIPLFSSSKMGNFSTHEAGVSLRMTLISKTDDPHKTQAAC